MWRRFDGRVFSRHDVVVVAPRFGKTHHGASKIAFCGVCLRGVIRRQIAERNCRAYFQIGLIACDFLPRMLHSPP